MQDIPRILDELSSASIKVISSNSPEFLAQVILDAIAELCGTEQVGFLVQRRSDGAFVVFESKMPRKQTDDLAAYFHLDEEQNQSKPVIIQLPDEHAAAYGQFYQNGWFSIALAPVNRERFSIVAWAVRSEDMPGFIDHELTALVLLAQYAALKFESYHDHLIIDDLLGAARLAKSQPFEDGMPALGDRHSGANQLREGNPALFYATSFSKGNRKIYTPGPEIAFNDKKRTITNGIATVHLTMTEARLFQALWNHQNEMLLHVELVQMTHGYQVDVEEASKILRPVVSRLRKKLEAFLNGERWIKNVRGTGYVMGEV